YGSDIGIGGVGTVIAAIVAAEHIGGEGTSLLAATSALSGFFLTGVGGEQGVVGGGHNGLEGVRRRGLAGAVAPGEQVDGAELEFPMGDVAPVYVDEFFEEHGLPVQLTIKYFGARGLFLPLSHLGRGAGGERCGPMQQ